MFGDEPDAEGEPDDTPGAAPSLSIPSAGPAPAPLPASLAVPSPKPPMPAPAPKNAPPILDAPSYAKFSHDIIMTAAMDGQVVLWDCRAASGAGYGVGRLWMGEKTPPWCLSVRHRFPCQMHLVSCDLNIIHRLAGLQMEARSTPVDEMAPLTCGMLGNSDDQDPRRYLVF